MVARTHDLAAFSALAIVALSQPLPNMTVSTFILCILGALIGGIAPDIDQPTAPFWRNLPIGKYFGRIFDDVTGGHRFLTHSIIGLVLFGFAAHWLLVFLSPIMPRVDIGYVWWSFMIGMFSHLVLDSLTKEGVPWLLPIPVKFGLPPVKRLRMTTGKRFEKFVVFPLLAAITIWWLMTRYNQIVAFMQSLRH